jgi:L,D-transpeptidase ErfK/SrfK
MPGNTVSCRTAVLLQASIFVLVAAALCGSTDRSPAAGTIMGDRWVHLVSRGETWTSVGARVGVSPAVLAARNQRSLRDPLRPGDVLGIDNRHVAPAYERDELVINIPQRMLFHYSTGGLRGAYPVAVGRPDWPTPLGAFVVAVMETDPTWDVPLSIQEEMRRAGRPVQRTVPPGPANPLGRYWVGLSLGSIGIHGTSAPASIYHYATHGCIRLHPDDIEDLFWRLVVGDPGRLVYEPVLVGFDGTDVFLEVHADAYQRRIDRLARARQLLDQTGLASLVTSSDVERVIREAEGLAVPITESRR